MVRAFWAKPVVAKRRWKLASHALAGNPTVASRPERTVETMNLSVILFSGPTSTTLPHQPPCGWISACRRWNGSKPRGPADEVAQSQRRRRGIFVEAKRQPTKRRQARHLPQPHPEYAATTPLPPTALSPLRCQRKILPETSNFASPPAEPEGFLLDQTRRGIRPSLIPLVGECFLT